MIQELKLPELGEKIESAVVGSILVSPGDSIAKDQPVIEVETDKATAEVPSPFAGVVKEIRVEKGKEIRVGQVILLVEETGVEARAGGAVTQLPAAPAAPAARESETPAAAVPPPAAAAPAGTAREHAATAKPAAPTPAAAAPAAPAGGGDSVPAAPAVRRLARELGIDIADVAGSGPGGRLAAGDVTAHARRLVDVGGPGGPAATAARPALPDFSAWGEVRRETLSTVRRRTAEHLSHAWSVVPHVTQFDQADITEVEALRRRFSPKAEAVGGKLTITAILLRVAASALKIFPRFNASLDMGAGEIVYKSYIHLGVAVDAGYGLLVPVIRDVDRKNILRIAVELTDLSRRARDKKLSVDELRGASFTVSNLGGLGTTWFTPIVNWPEVAILGLGRATEQAVLRDGVFVPRLILPLSVSYDHRVIDGADAARFLRWVAEALEQPLKLALEG